MYYRVLVKKKERTLLCAPSEQYVKYGKVWKLLSYNANFGVFFAVFRRKVLTL